MTKQRKVISITLDNELLGIMLKEYRESNKKNFSRFLEKIIRKGLGEEGNAAKDSSGLSTP